MQISEHIDWLAFTTEEDKIPLALDELDMRIDPAESINPRHGYRQAYKLTSGATLMCGSAGGRLGAHFIFTGTALSNVRAAGKSAERRVAELAQHFAKNITRIDIAVDMIDADLTPHDIAHMWLRGECKTRLKTDKVIGQVERVETFNLGTRRRRQIRVYDKILELNLKDFEKKWTRVEMETRRGAENILKMIVDDSEVSLRSIVKRYIDFPESEHWQRAFSVEAAEIPHTKKAEPDTEQWILKTVPAPLARVLLERYRADGAQSAEHFIAELMRLVKLQIGRQVDKTQESD